MPDFDPRDVDTRERDDGIRDREEQYLSLGRGGGGLTAEPDDDVRSRDDDARDERDRDARDRHDDRPGDPRDVFGQVSTCHTVRIASACAIATATTR